MLRLGGWAIGLMFAALAVVVLTTAGDRSSTPALQGEAPLQAAEVAEAVAPVETAAYAFIPERAPTRDPPRDNCDSGGPPGAAEANAASLDAMAWTPFGHEEIGWRTYAPKIAMELATGCGPGSSRFAAALARWQGAHALPDTGLMDARTFSAMNTVWLLKRPFVVISNKGICPDPPPPERLAVLAPSEAYGGKTIQLRTAALTAYRKMVADARAATPAIAADKTALMVFSGYRDPDADTARCARDNNCQGVVRTTCSAHRTGLAVDLVVGSAPGYGVDSSADPNRLAMSRSPAYGWLVANAGRYGFVNYPYEPWHWEWTGEPIQ